VVLINGFWLVFLANIGTIRKSFRPLTYYKIFGNTKAVLCLYILYLVVKAVMARSQTKTGGGIS
jgi:hypothetical protein